MVAPEAEPPLFEAAALVVLVLSFAAASSLAISSFGGFMVVWAGL